MPTFLAGQILEADDLEASVGELLRLKPSVRASRSTAQSIASATYTAITFPTEIWDYNGGHSTVTDPNKVYALETAKHLTGAIWETDNNTTGGRFGKILHNGGATLGEEVYASLGVAPKTIGGQLMHFTQLDYVELQVRQDSGGALDVTYAALWLHWMEL